MSSQIQSFYTGKSILLTGITGFVGKVILEKYLRGCPYLKTVYILVREKKGESTQQRFSKSVLTSPVFDRLRRIHGANFDAFISEKICIVEGDLLQDNIGLSQEHQSLIIQNCHILVNCAASIDFNAPLIDAIQINVQGTLRMFELAQKVQNLANFVHVSTAYVNADKRGGWVDEEIYDTNDDPERMIEELQKIPPEELVAQTQNILGLYPNTYVFTKSAAERIMKKNRPKNMTISIVRPSIVGAAHQQPIRGWVENITASTALFLLAGIGMVKYIHASNKAIGCIIPVDIVANLIVVVSALMAEKEGLHVFHSATSCRNPTTFKFSRDMVELYWNANPPEKQILKSQPRLIENERLIKYLYFQRQLPALVFQKLANVVGSNSMKMNANRLVKVFERGETVSNTFGHFATNQWIFDTSQSDLLLARMNEHDQSMFNIDVTQIQWREYFLMYNWGMHQFILQENVEPPFPDPDSSTPTNILSQSSQVWTEKQQSTYFSDIQWSINNGKEYQARSSAQYQKFVLSSPRVQHMIKEIIEEKSQDVQNTGQKDIHQEVERATEAIMSEIMAEYSMPILRVFAWTLNQMFNQIYDKVVLDEQMMTLLQNYDSKKNGPLILVPTHRSYIDFLIVSYIFFAFQIKCPYIAAAEDFLKVTFVHHILRASGAFFLQRTQNEYQKLYKIIFYEYVQRLLIDDGYIEFFVEGTRSRSFKMLHPQFGIMTIITDAVFDQKIPDASFVPITINYQKVLEGDTFPYQLLGEEKVKESLTRLIKAAKTLRQNYGQIHIAISPPISVLSYQQKLLKSLPATVTPSNTITKDAFTDAVFRKQLTRSLSYDIVYQLSDNLIITGTTIVATLLLMHRKGISQDLLVQRFGWLSEQLVARGAQVASVHQNRSGSAVAVKAALSLLEDIIVQTKKNVFQMSLSAQTDYQNILMLSYYRNGLMHVFFQEALVIAALNSFGVHASTKEGVAQEVLWEKFSFLQTLLYQEYITRDAANTFEHFRETLAQMSERGTITISRPGGNNGKNSSVIERGGEGFVTVIDDLQMGFLSSLVWPLVDSYWAVVSYLFTLQNSSSMEVQKFQMNIQWYASSLYDERIFDYFESCSLETIQNCLKVMSEMKIVQNFSEFAGKGKEKINLIKLSVSEEQLVEFENTLSQFLQITFYGQNSSLEVAQRNVLNDYTTFTPKL